MTDGVTQEGSLSPGTEDRVQARRLAARQIPLLKRLRRDGEGKQVPKKMTLNCQEKLLGREPPPVPQTDTGRWGEKPQARERTLVKELGKMTP